MKTHLRLTISGGCSESKNDLADDLRDFMLARGYKEVAVIKSDTDQPWDGLSQCENVEIRVSDINRL